MVQMVVTQMCPYAILTINTREHTSKLTFDVPGVNFSRKDPYSCSVFYSKAYSVDEIVNSIKQANGLLDEEIKVL